MQWTKGNRGFKISTSLHCEKRSEKIAAICSFKKTKNSFILHCTPIQKKGQETEWGCNPTKVKHFRIFKGRLMLSTCFIFLLKSMSLLLQFAKQIFFIFWSGKARTSFLLLWAHSGRSWETTFRQVGHSGSTHNPPWSQGLWGSTCSGVPASQPSLSLFWAGLLLSFPLSRGWQRSSTKFPALKRKGRSCWLLPAVSAYNRCIQSRSLRGRHWHFLINARGPHHHSNCRELFLLHF